MPPEHTEEAEEVTVTAGAGFTTIVKGTVAEAQPGEGVATFTVRLKS